MFPASFAPILRQIAFWLRDEPHTNSTPNIYFYAISMIRPFSYRICILLVCTVKSSDIIIWISWLYGSTVLHDDWLSLHIINHPLRTAHTHIRTHTHIDTQTHVPGTLMHQNEKRQGVLILTGGSGGICNFLFAANYRGNKTQEKWRLLV